MISRYMACEYEFALWSTSCIDYSLLILCFLRVVTKCQCKSLIVKGWVRTISFNVLRDWRGRLGSTHIYCYLNTQSVIYYPFIVVCCPLFRFVVSYDDCVLRQLFEETASLSSLVMTCKRGIRDKTSAI